LVKGHRNRKGEETVTLTYKTNEMHSTRDAQILTISRVITVIYLYKIKQYRKCS